jgi:hypothetical protein
VIRSNEATERHQVGASAHRFMSLLSSSFYSSFLIFGDTIKHRHVGDLVGLCSCWFGHIIHPPAMYTFLTIYFLSLSLLVSPQNTTTVQSTRDDTYRGVIINSCKRKGGSRVAPSCHPHFSSMQKKNIHRHAFQFSRKRGEHMQYSIIISSSIIIVIFKCVDRNHPLAPPSSAPAEAAAVPTLASTQRKRS